MKIEFHFKAAAFTLPPTLYWFIDACFSSYYIPLSLLFIMSYRNFNNREYEELSGVHSITIAISVWSEYEIESESCNDVVCTSSGSAWFWPWLKIFILIFISICISGRSRIFFLTQSSQVYSMCYIHVSLRFVCISPVIPGLLLALQPCAQSRTVTLLNIFSTFVY